MTVSLKMGTLFFPLKNPMLTIIFKPFLRFLQIGENIEISGELLWMCLDVVNFNSQKTPAIMYQKREVASTTMINTFLLNPRANKKSISQMTKRVLQLHAKAPFGGIFIPHCDVYLLLGISKMGKAHVRHVPRLYRFP